MTERLLITSPFTLWQLDALIPVYGRTRREVALRVIDDWFAKHGVEAAAYVKYVEALGREQKGKK
jgi:hypothetical protein